VFQPLSARWSGAGPSRPGFVPSACSSATPRPSR